MKRVHAATILSVLALGLMSQPTKAATAVVMGDSPQAIMAYFPSVIDSNFTTPLAVNTVVTRLTSLEITNLRAIYAAARGGSALQLDTAVRIYASAGNQTKWFQTAAPARAGTGLPSRAGVMPAPMMAGPSPTLDMTLREIYLEFRTAPFTSYSVQASLAETAIYAVARLAPSYALGYYIGSKMHDLIEYFDPEIDDAIGGTLDAMMQNLADAGTDASSAQYKKAIRDLFGVPSPSPGTSGAGGGSGGGSTPPGTGGGGVNTGGGGGGGSVTIECCVDLGDGSGSGHITRR